MIALQKPTNPFLLFQHPQTSMHFPSHRRNPSAPVVVRATHTPGLLSLAKPQIPQVPRSQQVVSNNRPNKTSPKPKSPRASQANSRPVEDAKKPSAPKHQPADENKVPSATPDKSSRGRQSSKPAPKDKADRRSISLSSRSQQRRRPQQSSPTPPSTRIPKQTDSTAEPNRARPLGNRDSDFNLSDPFVVHPSSDNITEAPKQSGSKNGAKALAFRPPPPLAARPTGKLAHRRQPIADMTGFTIPSATPTKPRNNAAFAGATPRRPAPRRASNSLPLSSWDFPVCDDSDESTPPSTPVRESTSVPPKKTGATWQQKALIFDEPPRTAPLSSTFQFPFTGSPSPSPTPAQRRRHHRVPSEGVFAMSTDEESSSDTSDEASATMNSKRRSGIVSRRSPSPASSDHSSSATPGFYAGSVFQNSPSPDELPIPAFMA